MKDERDPAVDRPQEERKPTPLYVRILALLGALAVVGLSIAYAYSIATGGIFWF